MSALTPASEVLLRHSDDFSGRHIIFAGDVQDSLPAMLDCATRRVHSQQYHRWLRLAQALQDQASYGMLTDVANLEGIDTLVYYWPKNKPEARFQLMDILSRLPVGCAVFVIGENRGGVRSAVATLAAYCPLTKIDSARRCSLYYGELSCQPSFDLADYWYTYSLPAGPAPLVIKSLPGVFSQDGLDAGSQLLISTFTGAMRGEVLDVGCGCGVLAATVARLSPEVRLTLCDVNASALAASAATLEANGLTAQLTSMVASDVFSAIQGQFDVIMSNPPFHEGLHTSLHAARELIEQAPRYLRPGGELRIVANGFLPYPDMLDQAFGNHQLLARTASFKVYQARR